MCQQRKWSGLFDHLGGAHEERRRDREAKEKEQKVQRDAGRADWIGNVGATGKVAARGFGGGI